jgi:hypothetical protein
VAWPKLNLQNLKIYHLRYLFLLKFLIQLTELLNYNQLPELIAMQIPKHSLVCRHCTIDIQAVFKMTKFYAENLPFLMSRLWCGVD